MKKNSIKLLFNKITSKFRYFFVTFFIYLLILVGISWLIIYLFYNSQIKQKIINDLINYYDLKAEHYSYRVYYRMEELIHILQNLRTNFSSTSSGRALLTDKDIIQRMHSTIESNSLITRLFTIWQPGSVIKKQSKTKEIGVEFDTTQYFVYILSQERYYVREEEWTIEDINLLHIYARRFIENPALNLIIEAPYISESELLKDSIPLVRMIAPVKRNNRLVAIVGMDIYVSNVLKDIDYQVLSQVYLLNSKLTFIYHKDSRFVGKDLEIIMPELNNTPLVNAMIEGIDYSEYGKVFSDKPQFIFSKVINLTPFEHWILVYVENDDYYRATVGYYLKTFIIISVSFLFLIFLGALGIYRILKRQIIILSKILAAIRDGDISVDVRSRIYKYKDFQIVEHNIWQLFKKMEEVTNFTKELAKGNYEIKPLKPYSDKDILVITLNELLEKLKETQRAHQEFLKQQELERWRTQGIAKFNDLMRKYINDLETLAYETISELTDYVNGVVGAFYVYNEIKQKLELTGYYAYTRKIYEKKEIELGDGLAGTIALEKKPLVTRVPEDYVEIATGLGKAKPNYIAVYPLITANVLYGVIEIAKIEEFKDYELEFLEEVSNVVASTLASARVAAETKKLLDQSRIYTEELKKKEAQLEKTIKELEKLRKQSDEQNIRLRSIIDALSEVVYYIEFSPTKRVLNVNTLILKVLNLSEAEAMAKTYFDILNIPIDKIDEHKQYWKELERGRKITFVHQLSSPDGEKTYWINATLIPILHELKLDRVIFIGLDITQTVEKEQQVQKMILEIQEKEEKLKIQEQEIQYVAEELEALYKELENKDALIEELKEKLQRTTSEYEHMINEFRKRINRFRKIEATLTQKVETLKKELKECRKKLNIDDLMEDENQEE